MNLYDDMVTVFYLVFLNVRIIINSYILNVPLEGSNETSSAIVYAWIGSKSDADTARLIEQIAEEKFNNPWVSLQVMSSLNITILQNKSKLNMQATDKTPSITQSAFPTETYFFGVFVSPRYFYYL